MTSPSYISIDLASQRSGLSTGQIRRLCGTTWKHDGRAKLEKQPNGQSAYVVREDADPRFAAVVQREVIGAQVRRAMTDKQRKDEARKSRILDKWEEEVEAGRKLRVNEEKVTASFLDWVLINEGLKICRATLFNWRRKRSREGAIVDGRSLRAKPEDKRGEDPFFAFVRELFLSPRGLKLRECWLLADQKAIEQGWERRSEAQCKRYIRSLPRQLIIRYRQGEKAFVALCEPALERDYASLASNDIWSGDDHRFDVLVAVPDGKGGTKHVRPWITAWEDIRSRKIVGYAIYDHDPNADVILRAFLMAAESHGIPRKVEVDNGKTYESRAIQGVSKKERQRRVEIDPQRLDGAFNVLDVKVTHVWKYHGQSKPIERQFRTVCDRFARYYETYIGNRPENRPEDAYRHVKAGKAPTLQEFAAAFSGWLEGTYHTTPHTGDAMDRRTPDEVFEQCLAVKRTVPTEILHFACAKPFGRRAKGEQGVVVGKQGVTYKGLHFGAFDPHIQKHFGQRVMLKIDIAGDDEAGRLSEGVLVTDMEGRLIGRARPNRKLPFNASEQDLRDAIAEKKQLRKTLREYVKRRPRMAEDHHQLAARAAARRAEERAASQPAEPIDPPSVGMVRTAFDGQFDVIRKAMQPRGKMAVGAEALDPMADLESLRPRSARPAPARDEVEEIDVFGALSAAVAMRPAQEDES
jgi:hypothetical protein